MNEYPPELDVMDRPEAGPEPETLPDVSACRPEPETHRRSAPPSRSRGGDWTGRLPLIFSALALVLASAALALALRGGERAQEPEQPPAPAPEEPVTFRFGDRTLTPLEGMPLNPYDRAAFSADGEGRVSYEKAGTRARLGIDVSSHQEEIDWPAVAADGIDFAMIRLGRRGYTEGGLYMDRTFEQNLQGAMDAGLDTGVYFFSQAISPQEAEEEADYIVEALAGRELAYPIAFDWEPIAEEQSRTKNLDGEILTRCAAAFCARVEAAGYEAAVYFNQSQGYLHYDLRELTDYGLWLAEYDGKPDFYYHFDLWQYTHTGRVDGIKGDVDLDLDLRQGQAGAG